MAFAEHANDPSARQILADPYAERDQMITLIVVSLLSIVPIALYARAVRQRLGRHAKPNEIGVGAGH